MIPDLTVLVPCRNEVRFVGRCLDSILASDYPPGRMEVLVIDGASTDGTRELIAAYQARDARVRLIDNPEEITPCALNRGIRAARGEVIARVDAHAAVAPDYFTLAVEHLAASGADNVGGVMRTLPQDSGPWAEAIVAALSHRFGVGNSHFRVGSRAPRWVDTVFGGCWRREVFARVGLFHPSLARSQDIEFSRRLAAAGGRTLLVPAMASDYYARSTLRAFWRHNLTNGEWSILPFLYSPVMPVSVRHLVPLSFVAALAASLAAWYWTALPLAVVTVPYVLASALASLEVAVRARRARYALRMPFVFLVLHVSYGLGSLRGVAQLALHWWRRRSLSEEQSCIPQS